MPPITSVEGSYIGIILIIIAIGLYASTKWSR